MGTRIGWFALVALLLPRPCWGLDVLEFQYQGRRVVIEGKLLAQGPDGSMLALGPDGVIWEISPESLPLHQQNSKPFEPLSAEQVTQRVLAELDGRFHVWQTKHYTFCYNTDREFARWCGQLFERLYRAFTNYWRRRGFPIHEPDFPLVVIVFKDQPSYAAYAGKELGVDPAQIPGFYSLRTNRICLYDLTSTFSVSLGGVGRQAAADRQFAGTVATIVHEATHQIAFNCGLQRRYADNPRWLTEGMAIYFETPDLSNREGWRTMGAVNHARLWQFRDYVARRRPADSLRTLVRDDSRFRHLDTGTDAYAEAWALNYFLIRTRPQQYHDYLRILNGKVELQNDTPEQRLADFQAAFGQNLGEFDEQLLRYMSELR